MSNSGQSLNTIHRIAVITGLDLIGDALIKLPFVRALRHAFPDAEICWVTSKGATAFNGALRDTTRTLIDRIYEQPPWLGIKERRASPDISAPHFDLILDTRNRWREALIARQIPHGLFIAPAFRYLLSDRHPPYLASKPQHISDRLLQMITLVTGAPTSAKGSLLVSADYIRRARIILPPGPSYIGIAPGAGNPIKIWPRANFEILAQAQVTKNRVPVFLLGPKELGAYNELSATIPSAIFALQKHAEWGTSELSLHHTLAIGSLLDAAVANDSGTGHMLAAVDCPIVSLFGPTSPTKCAPRSSRVSIVSSQEFGSAQISDIPVHAVEKALELLMLRTT